MSVNGNNIPISFAWCNVHLSICFFCLHIIFFFVPCASSLSCLSGMCALHFSARLLRGRDDKVK